MKVTKPGAPPSTTFIPEAQVVCPSGSARPWIDTVPTDVSFQTNGRPDPAGAASAAPAGDANAEPPRAIAVAIANTATPGKDLLLPRMRDVSSFFADVAYPSKTPWDHRGVTPRRRVRT
ncbi:hypothetical protein GCM10023317_48090 [Actinopolymorpha pittospori]